MLVNPEELVEFTYCIYCGSSENIQNDHVVPYSYNHLNTKHRLNKSKKGTVPACRECNQLLGNKFYITVPERAAYLLTVYTEKYNKLSASLEKAGWTEEELSELGRNLQTTIRSSIFEKNNLLLRFEHVELISNSDS